MEIFLLYVAIMAVLVYGIIRMRGIIAPMPGHAAAELADLEEPLVSFKRNQNLLRERWQMAGVLDTEVGGLTLDVQQTQPPLRFPDNYFEAASPAHYQRLRDAGFRLAWLQRKSVTAGQADDLLGLLRPPADRDAEVLDTLAPVQSQRRGQREQRAVNLTAAAHQAALLLADDEARQRWLSAPVMSRLQRSFFVWHELEVPPAETSAADAEAQIQAALADMSEEQAENWKRFCALYQALNESPGYRQLWPVNAELLLRAVRRLLQNRHQSMSRLHEHPDLVIDELLDLDPGLSLEPSEHG